MCTSFTLFSSFTDEPLTAMNLDHYLPYKLALIGGNQFSLLATRNGNYYRPLGVNKSGTFMNTQLVNRVDEAKYRQRGPDVTTEPYLIDDILTEKILPEDLEEYFSTHTVVYRRNGSGVHNMIRASNDTFFVVDPGRGVYRRHQFPKDFAILTNTPMLKYLPLDDASVQRIRCQRFRKVWEMLHEPHHVDVDRAFAILETVKQTGGKLPTMFSMVSVPRRYEVYFCLYADFSKRYRFSFEDNHIYADKGFIKEHKFDLSKRRPINKTLQQWQ